MAFILSDQRATDVEAAFRRYGEYLERRRPDFPRGAYSLATSDWYYDGDDHRCPHDAWLECNAVRARNRLAARDTDSGHAHTIARFLP